MRATLVPAALALGLLLGGAASPLTARADLVNARGQHVGDATLSEAVDAVRLQVRVRGLTPGPHGFHVHVGSRATPPDFKDAGGHFNPTGAHHGHMNPLDGAHLGDLPNLIANPAGVAVADLMITGVTLAPGTMSIATGTLVIHADPDDYRSDPAGSSGGRVVAGAIRRTR